MNELLIVKLIVLSSCAVCKLIGELWQHNLQRFVMPIILGIGVSITSHTWWMGGTVLLAIAPLCMGYSTYGKSNGFDRGIWLFLIAVAAGLGCLLTGHLAWYFYAPYCILSGVWGSTTRNLWNVIIAPLSGALIGSIIFLVH